MDQSKEPAVAKEAVLQESSKLPENTPQIRGYDWNEGYSYENIHGAVFLNTVTSFQLVREH